MVSFHDHFMQESAQSVQMLAAQNLDSVVKVLCHLRENHGRLFIAGVGGSAGNAVHAAADFRKLAAIESYALLENLSELTAVTNDLGWNDVFTFALKHNNFSATDLLMIFSVGGGSEERNLSIGLINAIKFAKNCGGKVVSFTGKGDGYAAQNSDISIIGRSQDGKLITPISESLQAFFWHYLVSHPDLATQKPVW